MRVDMEDIIKQLMADILNIDSRSIDDSTSIDNIESWDSMNHLNICLALEQEFNISLEVDEMESMISFYDIVQVISTKI